MNHKQKIITIITVISSLLLVYAPVQAGYQQQQRQRDGAASGMVVGGPFYHHRDHHHPQVGLFCNPRAAYLRHPMNHHRGRGYYPSGHHWGDYHRKLIHQRHYPPWSAPEHRYPKKLTPDKQGHSLGRGSYGRIHR